MSWRDRNVFEEMITMSVLY